MAIHPFFTHDAIVPVDFANSVYNVMHNIAGCEDWELFDEYSDNGYPIMDWILSVLVDNGMKDKLEKEKVWWEAELAKRKT